LLDTFAKGLTVILINPTNSVKSLHRESFTVSQSHTLRRATLLLLCSLIKSKQCEKFTSNAAVIKEHTYQSRFRQQLPTQLVWIP